MHPVKVYDASGKLKKVISVKTLTERSEKLIESPTMFRKNARTAKAQAQSTEVATPESE